MDNLDRNGTHPRKAAHQRGACPSASSTSTGRKLRFREDTPANPAAPPPVRHGPARRARRRPPPPHAPDARSSPSHRADLPHNERASLIARARRVGGRVVVVAARGGGGGGPGVVVVGGDRGDEGGGAVGDRGLAGAARRDSGSRWPEPTAGSRNSARRDSDSAGSRIGKRPRSRWPRSAGSRNSVKRVCDAPCDARRKGRRLPDARRG